MQKKYLCSCSGEKGKKSWSALKAVQYGLNTPQFILNVFPIHQTYRSAVTLDVLCHVLSDSMSGKSFGEQAATMGELRVHNYVHPDSPPDKTTNDPHCPCTPQNLYARALQLQT